MKADLRGATNVNASMLASKTDLANLQAQLVSLHVNKLKTVPADLSKLCNVVDNDVIKKTVYNQLFTKVNAIDTKISGTSELITKPQYDSDQQSLEKKTEQKDWQNDT